MTSFWVTCEKKAKHLRVFVQLTSCEAANDDKRRQTAIPFSSSPVVTSEFDSLKAVLAAARPRQTEDRAPLFSDKAVFFPCFFAPLHILLRICSLSSFFSILPKTSAKRKSHPSWETLTFSPVLPFLFHVMSISSLVKCHYIVTHTWTAAGVNITPEISTHSWLA